MDVILGLIILAILLGLYFLPTIIAVSRHKRNAVAIGALNLLLGWTLVAGEPFDAFNADEGFMGVEIK